MVNYIASIVFGFCICWFVRLCEIFTSCRLQPQLAFEVMSHVHYKMAGHKWLLRLYEKTTAWWMHSELGVTCSLQDGWLQMASEITWKDKCMIWTQNLGWRFCQTFNSFWLRSQLVSEVMSNVRCRVIAVTAGFDVMSNVCCTMATIATGLWGYVKWSLHDNWNYRWFVPNRLVKW
jgi:hypothetical protein